MLGASVEQKIKRISEDLCAPWAEKITNALFKDAPTQELLQKMKANKESQLPSEKTSTPESESAPEAETEPKPESKPTRKEIPSGEDKEGSVESEEDLAELEELRQREELVFEEREIEVEFDWGSFGDLFSSLINEGAAEVIDTILDSLISKDCAISLLSSLLEHCKTPSNMNPRVLNKHEQIRSFMQVGLKKYVIKYSDDPREWGFFKDGVLCDVVEIDVTDDEEINWIFRDVTQNIENSSELQQFIVSKYSIPLYRWKIKRSLHKDIRLVVDWTSIDYAAQDYAKAVFTIYHENSAFVLDELYRAFEAIAVYEDDDLVDAVAFGIKRVIIAMQPGIDSTRKDFDIDNKKKSLTLRCCLEADEFSGVFRHRDLVPIIKLAGLYDTSYSKLYKEELLAAAAQTYKVPRGDLTLFKQVLTRKDFWREPDQKELDAIEGCKRHIDRYYKERLQGWSDPQYDDGYEEEEEEEYEKLIKGWHVIKFNKRNMHQERYVLLTNKAYWTFKWDHDKGKVDEKHFKRHDLLDFCVVDIGILEQTEDITIQAMKIFTREKRKPNVFGQKFQEVVALQDGKGKRSKISMELRKSLKIKPTTTEDFKMFQNIRLGITEDEDYKPREKRQKPTRDRPSIDDCYSSVFIPFGELDPQELKEILKEISWCLYAASVSRQRTRGYEPYFNQQLTRPKGGLSSFFYNTLSLGMSSKKRNSSSLNLKGSGGDRVKEKRIGDAIVAAPDSPAKEARQVVRHTPTNDSSKTVKPILKRRDGADGEPVGAENENAAEEEDDGDGTVFKASHDRRVIFRPEVQVFYHDLGDDESDYYGDSGDEDGY